MGDGSILSMEMKIGWKDGEDGRLAGIIELPLDIPDGFISSDVVHNLIGKELLDINVDWLHIRQVGVQKDFPNPLDAGTW
ncbi:hypothetical protein IGI04_018721 [Brassica rapa subsp. trilocularis]|uniref:Uncharacterized protein n=1 Tax=Brassica rapa subsp. trilocularis TaxID=1813537 RepID=A0ABQ7MDR7_BRACM|nr:hypothetical protein IGI04_018721 [Brassica rapa subsp. trilocularis]